MITFKGLAVRVVGGSVRGRFANVQALDTGHVYRAGFHELDSTVPGELARAVRRVSRGETARERLEYLRGEILAERISLGELAELQTLKKHIRNDDILLCEWAGIPEGKKQGV